MAFITVYSKTTGRRQQIPEAWWGHPVLGRDFRKTPPPSEAGASKASKSKTTRGAGRQRAGDNNDPANGDKE